MSLASKNKVDPNFNMSSMTDMIFLLLIFFMLTSNFVAPSSLPLSLPTTSAKKTVTTSIKVEITKAKAYLVNGTSFPEDLLEDEIKSQLDGADEKFVSIVAQEDVPMQLLVTVAGIASKYDAKVSVTTVP